MLPSVCHHLNVLECNARKTTLLTTRFNFIDVFIFAAPLPFSPRSFACSSVHPSILLSIFIEGEMVLNNDNDFVSITL